MLARNQEFDAILRTDLCAFVQRCFVHLNPGTRFERNWHHEAITYQLDRVFCGDVKRLIVNAPPRGLKSLIGSVAFPAWVMGKQPTAKFLCLSYSQNLTNKHAGDFRSIVQADWYKRIFRTPRRSRTPKLNIKPRRGAFA